jgi:perosamine synthetase
MQYPVYTPNIKPYTRSIQKAIEDGWISSQGEFIVKAQDECKRIIGTPYCILLNNGTSATHLLYKSIKYKYPNIKKIYVPDYVFVGVWNCALYEYSADQLEVLQIDKNTLNMNEDEEYISSLSPNSAVIVVHNIGNVVNVPRLQRIRPDIVFVEDCCEAFLEEYEGKKVGTSALCAAVSFFGNKIITTGEGGLWYTNDKELYQYLYRSCHHGMTSERYIYDVLGYNYRMTNLQAAFLYDQLTDIDNILSIKRKVYNRYIELFKNTDVQPITAGLWMFVVRIPNNICNYSKFGIDTRPMFYNIHAHQHLRNIPYTFQNIHHSEICMIPSSPSLTSFDQTYIANSIVHRLSNLSIRKVTLENIELLDRFINQQLPDTFRYFRKHDSDYCLKHHTITLIGLYEEEPICYGHIDETWIGICVLPDYQSRGYGKQLMDFLMKYAILESIHSLRLTVDKTNNRAIALYKKYQFSILSDEEKYYLMERHIKK